MYSTFEKKEEKKNRIPKDFQSESRQLQRSYHALHVNFLERSSMSSLATSVIETCILLSNQKIPLAFKLNLVKTVHFSVFRWDTCPGKMGTRFGCTPKGSNDNFFPNTTLYRFREPTDVQEPVFGTIWQACLLVDLFFG